MAIYLYENQESRELCPSIVPYDDVEPKYVVDASNVNLALQKLVEEGKDLRNLDLSQSDTKKTSVLFSSWRSLGGFKMKDVDLSGCNLSRNLISTTDMSGCNLSDCKMDDLKIVSTYGTNVNFNWCHGNNIQVLNSVFIEPSFRYSNVPNMQWGQSKWCLQRDQIKSVLEDTLENKQNVMTGAHAVEGSNFKGLSSFESAIPRFANKTNFVSDFKSCEKTTHMLKVGLIASSVSTYLCADAITPALSKINNIANGVFTNGSLDTISHIIHTNPLLCAGMGFGTFASITISKGRKFLKDLVKDTFDELKLKYRNLPSATDSFLDKFNHIFFASNRRMIKNVTSILKKTSRKSDMFPSFMTKKGDAGYFILCNKKHADLAMKEIMTKMKDNSVTFKERVTMLFSKTDENNPKSLTFNPDGTSLVINMDNNNTPLNAISFDKSGASNGTFDLKNGIIAKEQYKGELNNVLGDMLSHVEKMREISNRINLNYDAKTHFIENDGNLIRVIDRNTMKIDNPLDYAAVKIGDHGKAQCYNVSQGKIMNKVSVFVSNLFAKVKKEKTLDIQDMPDMEKSGVKLAV